MSKNLQTPTKLTEFAPLSAEVKQDSRFSFANLFNFKRGGTTSGKESSGSVEIPASDCNTAIQVEQLHSPEDGEGSNSLQSQHRQSWQTEEFSDYSRDSDCSSTHSTPLRTHSGMINGEDGRNTPSLIRKIGDLIAMKNSHMQPDMRQYWMPDSLSKECFECGEKFTTFRRRHHCRVCGRIFCSRCCNKEIPAKIMGYTGDKRVCTQCCKDILAYIQSTSTSDLTTDLRVMPSDNNTQLKHGLVSLPVASNRNLTCVLNPNRRRSSVGYLEEKFVLGSKGVETSTLHPQAERFTEVLSPVERKNLLQDSVCLRALMLEICKPVSGVTLQNHRIRLKIFPSCFIGAELVDWFIAQGKAATRVQGAAIGQMLLDVSYLQCLSSSEPVFVDAYALYRPIEGFNSCDDPEQTSIHPLHEDWASTQEAHEPSWLKQIGMVDEPFIDTESDNINGHSRKHKELSRLASASSMFLLDMNVEESFVTISKSMLESKNSEDSDNSISKKDGCNENVCVSPILHMDSSIQEISEEFLNTLVRQVNARKEFITPLGWYNGQHMQKENGEQEAFEKLSELYKTHERTLLLQLLTNSGLSFMWADTILPLVHRVVDQVRPDVKESNEDTDIRQYVQIKKIPGGDRTECSIVNGVVCSKNVAHRSMLASLVDPQILLLNSAIVYQRLEKLLSLEPLWMQEPDYLQNAVTKILAMKPNLLLVEKNVARFAQELLCKHNITLALNIKPSVMERVSRCTQADVLPSLEAQVGPPRLGMCHKFSVQNFTLDSGKTKPLMFFEGCASHLGCTVLLRGASYSELKRVKRVLSFMVFMSYNWRLERSFLMDECAIPPPPVTEPIFSAEDDKHVAITHKKTRSGTLKSIDVEETKMEEICDFSDPLQSYLNSDVPMDVLSPVKNDLSMKVEELPQENLFRKAIIDVLLSTSPLLKYSLPFLETDTGKRSPLRSYFPAEIYWSAQFNKRPSTNITKQKPDDIKDSTNITVGKNNFIVSMAPPHLFISAKLSSPITNPDIQSLLAQYRAMGGRLKTHTPQQSVVVTDDVKETEMDTMPYDGRVDALNPVNHQKFLVLFCSFSRVSSNAPYFCVSPWTVTMDFYGRNDVPLGCFLERYCFSPAYTCPIKACDTTITHHIRRFVHESGCLQIVMKAVELSLPSVGDSILTWSWCCSCSQVSPILPLSIDAWSLSFAKYLELRFHGNQYTRRGGSDGCTHSLHHNHHQYFLHKNLVAAFKFSNIHLWEVYIPPTMVYVHAKPQTPLEITSEMRDLSVKGAEVFSAIQDRLHSLKEESQDKKYVGNLMAQFQIDHSMFRDKIAEIQLKLTSRIVETRNTDGTADQKAEQEYNDMMWNVGDCTTYLKYMISEAVHSWNGRLQELLLQRKKEEKLAKSSGNKVPTTVQNPTAVQEISSTKNMDPGFRLDSLDDMEIQHNSTIAISISTTPSVYSSHETLPPSIGDIADSIRNSQDSLMQVDSDSVKMDEDRRSINEPVAVRSQHNSGSSVYGHERSHSDGEGIILRNRVDEVEKHEAVTRRSTTSGGMAVKNLFSHLLGTGSIIIQCPLSPEEHYALQPTGNIPVIMFENEPTSVIAYSLGSTEYDKQLNTLRSQVNKDTPSSNSGTKQNSKSIDKDLSVSNDLSLSVDSTISKRGVMSFFRGGGDKSASKSNLHDSASLDRDNWTDIEEREETDNQSSKNPNQHIDIQFSSVNAKFYCRVYYAEQFRLLRRGVFPEGEECFLRSLLRCVHWDARGGKSGCTFCKTVDDRFILKQMSRFEIQSFLEFAPNYFGHLQKSQEKELPTALAKVLGVYRIGYKNLTTNAASKMDVLIMENLFYKRCITQKFDLKGSMRNRLVNVTGNVHEDMVLLDENLLKMACENPLYIRPHSKTVLTLALNNDTQFLASQMVMDYSLLVGMDVQKNELVVGIIDYIRTFTWDKKLEHLVKSSGILGGQGKMPTVVSPELYQSRFCEAMDRYLLMVPDRWGGMGKGVDC